MKKLHLMMPMGGRGSRFSKDGFALPKPLIELQGKPFFYWAIRSVTKFIETADIICIVLQEHVEQHHIDEAIHQWFPQAKLVVIPEVLDGPVLTCLEGLQIIDDDAPILVNDCDHLFVCEDFNAFCRAGDFAAIDGALLSFSSQAPCYSYLEKNTQGNVIRTVEKQVISNEAICGAYYFKNKALFLAAAEQYLHACAYKEYFMSGLYNMMAAQQAVIKSFSTDLHISFGTPEEFSQAQQNPDVRRVE